MAYTVRTSSSSYHITHITNHSMAHKRTHSSVFKITEIHLAKHTSNMIEHTNLVPTSCLWPTGQGTNSRSHPDMRPPHTRAYAQYADISHLVSHAHAWVGSFFRFRNKNKLTK
jgi:hypothetical protein